jgi:hypothetical protein
MSPEFGTVPGAHVGRSGDSIAAEVRAIRKGRGVNRADLDRRLGPHLTALAGDGPAAGAARQALAAQLTRCAGRLPEDLRAAVSASLGLSPPTRQMRLFDERAGWLATQLNVGHRTALGRIEAGELLLAEEIAGELGARRGREPVAPGGWYLAELRTLLRLDTPTPEAYEHRRIVATRDGLTEVVAWLDVPPPGPSVTGEVTYGGRLIRSERPTRQCFRFLVELPVPLHAGRSHEYSLHLWAGERDRMRPHYVLTPESRTDGFELRVRFDPERPPRWVRRVDGETVGTLDTAGPGTESLYPDRAGEVRVRFDNLTMYLGYGLQWQP